MASVTFVMRVILPDRSQPLDLCFDDDDGKWSVNQLLLRTLATKRIARLVVDDAILDDLREKLYEKFPPESHKIGYLVTCIACTSVWAGAIVASGILPERVVQLLAYSEATVIVGELVDRFGEG